jgi:hypothetical protein
MQNVPFAAQQEQVNKFLQANRVLGAQMDQMQGTTQCIYDTQNMVGLTQYDFFSEVSGKSNTLISNSPATNINENRFQPGEGMVIKELGIVNVFSTTAANVANINDYLAFALINIYVGNNRVIKDLPLFSLIAKASISNLSHVGTSTTGAQNARYAITRLFTNIVIPPQIQFYCNVRLPQAPTNAAGLNASLRVYFKGYGKLFNPRNNY